MTRPASPSTLVGFRYRAQRDRVGERRGRLTVLALLWRAPEGQSRHTVWQCRCDCGAVVDRPWRYLGCPALTPSCGAPTCLRNGPLTTTEGGRSVALDLRLALPEAEWIAAHPLIRYGRSAVVRSVIRDALGMAPIDQTRRCERRPPEAPTLRLRFVMTDAEARAVLAAATKADLYAPTWTVRLLRWRMAQEAVGHAAE